MLAKFKKLHLDYILLSSIFIVAAYFRFASLGYSDLQGDEAKIFLYRSSTNFLDFLFANSKGPGQYLIVRFTELISPNSIDTEFLYRLPFALAGFFSVYLFYHISKKFFNFETGINVLLIASINSFFIAFSRIVQYQSFNILLGLLSTLFFLNFLKNNSRNNLFLSSLFSAIGILFHYDALGFIIPQIILIFLTQNKAKNYLIYLGGFAVSLIFYIPYVLSEKFPETLNYILKERTITNFSYDSVLYSLKLSTLYFPKEYLIIVFALVALSLWNLKISKMLHYKVIMAGLLILLVARYMVGHPYKPFILLSTILGLTILFVIFINKELQITKKYFFIWFIFTFITYILVINKPLTHIYNIFIPLTFLAGLQLNEVKNKYLKYGALSILFLSGASFNYQAYIENKVEYPWQSENYIFGNMYDGVSEGEVVRGIFGFPYYRGLDNLDNDLSLLIDKNTSPIFYANIKLSRLDFYLNREYPVGQTQVKYYIVVKGDRDYEPENPIITNSAKTKLMENENYAIYEVL